MDSRASLVSCSCGGTGYRWDNWKQPENYPLEEIGFCEECPEGEKRRAYWVGKKKEAQAQRLQRMFLDSGIPLEYEDATIELVESLGDPEKAAAVAACRELVETGQVSGKHSLCLIGSYGTGKTTLLSAVLREYMARGEVCLWIALAELFREVQRSYSQGGDEADKKIDAAMNAGVLLIDDFGKANINAQETEDKVRIIDTIINYRHNMRKPTLITSNLTPDEWRVQFGQRTSDRVYKMCAVVVVAGVNLRVM